MCENCERRGRLDNYKQQLRPLMEQIKDIAEKAVHDESLSSIDKYYISFPCAIAIELIQNGYNSHQIEHYDIAKALDEVYLWQRLHMNPEYIVNDDDGQKLVERFNEAIGEWHKKEVPDTPGAMARPGDGLLNLLEQIFGPAQMIMMDEDTPGPESQAAPADPGNRVAKELGND